MSISFNDLSQLKNGSGQGVSLIDTTHFALSQVALFKIGTLIVGSVILQCTANFTGGDMFQIDNTTFNAYGFGIGVVTAGQWSYDVTKTVRIYYKTSGMVALTSNVTSGQYLTIPICIKATA